ncbi:MAG: hypothetical protein AUJ52_14805 [Elusimicrobia bacterium CG1_02_63_36]|nr:MAG: hypothetical protein AUJ52_14805 [Elusimicrobia bacterium CG1_02_63_36]PIP82132.1 MAG: hypothetical protein COR54_16450 [Elusimicrobia bacterium CG22_combo_CG10-13_8_21_14_all_63_91]PJA11784.1 MAG: hypothetical protein COX66_18895 [Elusimicrobia bacterium CG_4_10_14_0_2_um_filter_63_34]PJB24976.1 MAG: hypothetical protein CO113_11080 [Elusimicrobia bacterium CG_4_9_14_3_um_filter_62_55]
MKKNMKTDDEAPASYALSDFYLAAYLIAEGLPLLRLDPAGGSRVLFVLEDSPRREALIQDFYGHRAGVDPLAYKNAIVDLKSLIHGLRRERPRP